jgi:phosphoglucosamine mutase
MIRKLFGTDGIRGIANVYPITPEIALQVGKAIAYSIRYEKNPKIVIGKDTRLSGYMIETALTSGIVSMGVDVYLVGPIPTPAVALLTKSLNAQAGIVISASHNPAEDNGIKIFDKKGFKLSDEKELKIETSILSEEVNKEEIQDIVGNKIGKAHRIDEAKGRYIEFAKSTIKNFSLEGLKIILDCANGAAYSVAPKVFSELGAEIIILNDKPDGLNINNCCGAMHPEITAEIVKSEKADIGLILDGDADRLIVCDENGKKVDGDHILAILAIDLKEKNKLKNDTVVATVMANKGFDIAMKDNNIKIIKTKVGDRYIIEEMIKNDYNLGGEQSGHIILLDHVTTGDGILTALQILKIIKEKNNKISELAQCMHSLPQVLINKKVKEKKPFEDMIQVTSKVKEIERILGDNGRVLLRYSGTENVVRVMVEGPDKEIIKNMAKDIIEEIKKEAGE